MKKMRSVWLMYKHIRPMGIQILLIKMQQYNKLKYIKAIQFFFKCKALLSYATWGNIYKDVINTANDKISCS